MLAEQRRRQTDEVRGLPPNSTGSVVSEPSWSGPWNRRASAPARPNSARRRRSCGSRPTIETLRRELDIEPAVAEAAEMPELPEGASPAGRVRELDRELRLLGPINPLALEEFNELQGRHKFLEEQLEDVRTHASRSGPGDRRGRPGDPERVRGGLRRRRRRTSRSCSRCCSRVASGKLVLTAPDDMLNTGIEVEAKPGGKNVKKLSLLSGGERSLTALAYLFAVFRSRPSPFYVMDEVEAALDDVNLHRFLGLVQEFRKDAQLIVVSHQKRTMEAGDCLLGVTHAARRLEQGRHRTRDGRQRLRARRDLTLVEPFS